MQASVPADIVELEAAFDVDRTIADRLAAALVTKTSDAVPNEMTEERVAVGESQNPVVTGLPVLGDQSPTTSLQVVEEIGAGDRT